jgi:tripartite-type tricarboxylate transporter receptor subunit TctC
MPDFRERITGAGLEPGGGSPARFLDVLRRDVERWHKVVKTANIKVAG